MLSALLFITGVLAVVNLSVALSLFNLNLPFEFSTYARFMLCLSAGLSGFCYSLRLVFENFFSDLDIHDYRWAPWERLDSWGRTQAAWTELATQLYSRRGLRREEELRTRPQPDSTRAV